MFKNYIISSKTEKLKNLRIEKKFISDEIHYNKFLSWIYNFTDLKIKYNKRKIHSLYFDTCNFDAAKDNLAGASVREKCRLRWYNNNYNEIYFEIKQKKNSFNSKKRVKIKLLKKITDYSIKDLLIELKSQLAIFVTKDLNPVLLISYEREYFENVYGLRLTIDRNLTFSRILGSSLFDNLPRINYGKYIIELKFNEFNSCQIINFLKKGSFTSMRNSKYIQGLYYFGIVHQYF